jgi:hypothetical protein
MSLGTHDKLMKAYLLIPSPTNSSCKSLAVPVYQSMFLVAGDQMSQSAYFADEELICHGFCSDQTLCAMFIVVFQEAQLMVILVFVSVVASAAEHLTSYMW